MKITNICFLKKNYKSTSDIVVFKDHPNRKKNSLNLFIFTKIGKANGI